MPKSILVSELREKIKSRHLESAFAHIRREGGQDARGTRTLKNSKRAFLWVVSKDGEHYAQMHLGRLAYLFALKDAGEISEKPPFPKANERMGKIEPSALDWVLGHGKFADYPCHRLPAPRQRNSANG